MIDTVLDFAASVALVACGVAAGQGLLRRLRRRKCRKVGHRWALILPGAREAHVMAAEGVTFTHDDPLKFMVTPHPGQAFESRFICLRCTDRPADLIL